MKQELIDGIQEFADIHDFRFYDDYSGRCMYGKTCVGIVVDDLRAALAKLVLYLYTSTECDSEDFLEQFIDETRSDNMGLDYILYWPNLSVA